MSSGSGRAEFNRLAFEQELAETRQVLDAAEVAGWPRRDGDLDALRRLVKLYPAEARAILDEEP
jgi:hypothetical protein